MKTTIYLRLLVAAGLFAAAAVQAQTYTFSIPPGQTNANKHPILNNPHGVAVDASGNMYVADTGNHVIRVILAGGDISTYSNLVLGPVNPQDIDESPAFHFNSPMGIALDASGNIYVSDNNVIYEVTGTPANAVVTIVAGSTQGHQDGPAQVAKFNGAYGLAVDNSGNIWVADQNNSDFREITTNGVVITVTPIQVSNAHLPGKLADNDHFTGITIDHQNNIFLMDSADYVHEYSAANGISTIWSGGNSTSSRGLAVDYNDNVYIYDGGSNAVLCISPGGTATMLGNLPTSRGQIAGVAIDADKNLYMVDQVNNVIIKGTVSYPAFFDGQIALSKGVYYLSFADGTIFGYYNLGDFDFPWFYHYDMGYEYFFDDGNGGAYLYDAASGDFWYTSPQVFPFLYDFTLNAWLYYFPDNQNPGHYTSNPRTFYDFGTSQIITR
ncbi:MAG TPA: hypothetical protein VFB72_07610 [Verrucomicrobiae bacterium]|nr:hypothetical protein [Verrucomicrobiae bacterium]